MIILASGYSEDNKPYQARHEANNIADLETILYNNGVEIDIALTLEAYTEHKETVREYSKELDNSQALYFAPFEIVKDSLLDAYLKALQTKDIEALEAYNNKYGYKAMTDRSRKII